MENFYWQKGNQWDDNPPETEDIDTTNMINIGEYHVCTFCDKMNCNDYIMKESSWFDPDYYCKHKECKHAVTSHRFSVGEICTVSALYGGELTIKITARTENTITFIYTDDETEKEHTQDIIMQKAIESIEAWDYKGYKGHWYPSIQGKI